MVKITHPDAHMVWPAVCHIPDPTIVPVVYISEKRDALCSDNTINCTVVLPTIRDMPLTRPISLCSTTPSSSSAPTFLLMGPEPLCIDSTKCYFSLCPPCACIALETYIGVTHTITCFRYCLGQKLPPRYF